jgi:hypothetical protein
VTTARSTQSKASLARQALSVLVSVYGVLTTHGVINHLPAWASGILIAFAPVLLTVEHWLGDPSTGNAKAVVTAVEKEPIVTRLSDEARVELARLLGIALPAAPVPVAPATGLAAAPPTSGGL